MASEPRLAPVARVAVLTAHRGWRLLHDICEQRAPPRISGSGRLAESGYPAPSIERIARRAGSTSRRWGTREELVLEAMLERAGEHISVPDTGSLREDLLELARTAAANAASPEVAAMARA